MSLDALVLCSLDDSLGEDEDTSEWFVSSPQKPAEPETKTRFGRAVRRARRSDDADDADGDTNPAGDGTGDDDYEDRDHTPAVIARRRSPPRKRTAAATAPHHGASQPATPVRQQRGHSSNRSRSPAKSTAVDIATASSVKKSMLTTTVEVCGRTVDLSDLPPQPSLYGLARAWIEGGVRVFDSCGRRVRPPQARPRAVAAAVFQRRSSRRFSHPPQQSEKVGDHCMEETLVARWKRIGHVES